MNYTSIFLMLLGISQGAFCADPIILHNQTGHNLVVYVVHGYFCSNETEFTRHSMQLNRLKHELALAKEEVTKSLALLCEVDLLSDTIPAAEEAFARLKLIAKKTEEERLDFNAVVEHHNNTCQEGLIFTNKYCSRYHVDPGEEVQLADYEPNSFWARRLAFTYTLLVWDCTDKKGWRNRSVEPGNKVEFPRNFFLIK